ncbi:DNA helicase ZGRF1 domain-containing protein, partial [Mycobacterium tuberculosis]|uniref:DNA helicase ZGRF1 domain-containing protein n=1 Tax=Mycobacterium tuberculosis TaxID=1773 RepID=UPI00254D0C26
MPNDDKNRHSGPVDCGSSDEARSMDINVKSAQEWTALYTTQKTQKAKKYHDGIFRLVNRGSHMKQIIILNEE